MGDDGKTVGREQITREVKKELYERVGIPTEVYMALKCGH